MTRRDPRDIKEALNILVGIIIGALISAIIERYYVTEPIFSYFIISVLLVSLLAFFASHELRSIRNDIKNIVEILNALRYSYGHTEFFTGSEGQLERHFVEIVNNADKFIMCTGGISRQKEYLSSIEKRIREKEHLVYIRVFPRGMVSRFFYQHLQNIIDLENAEVRFLEEEAPIAYILCTEDIAVIGLPSPGRFRMYVRTNVPHVVENMKMYVQRLAAKSVLLKKREDLDKLVQERLIKIIE